MRESAPANYPICLMWTTAEFDGLKIFAQAAVRAGIADQSPSDARAWAANSIQICSLLKALIHRFLPAIEVLGLDRSFPRMGLKRSMWRSLWLASLRPILCIGTDGNRPGAPQPFTGRDPNGWD